MRLHAKNPYRRLALRVAQAMGVGALSAAAGGCGGEVQVYGQADDDGGGGAGGGSTTVSSSSLTSSTTTVSVSSSNVTVSSSTGGGWTCDPPLGPQQELVYDCSVAPLDNWDCPDASSGEVLNAIAESVYYNDYCEIRELNHIACGPDPTARAACCYVGVVDVQYCPGGRPFIVEGVARTAETHVREDWSARLKPNTNDLTARQRAVLAEAWLDMALDEHASIASFARFTLQLLALGAPPDLVRASERAARDEIAHAELCFGLASVYAGRALGPGQLDVGSSLGSFEPVDIARSVFREGCVGETISAMVAERAASLCVDPATRRALEVIARDEGRHAELAWKYIGWSAQQHDGVLEAIEQELAALLHTCDQAPTLREGDDGQWAARHGQLSARQRRKTVQRTVRDVVIPCAEVLLDLSPNSHAA